MNMKLNNIKLYFINRLVSLLPDTRFYFFKVLLYRACGFDVHETARLVSSVKILGNFHIEIGKDTFIGHDVLMTGGSSSIKIGNYVDIGPRVCIVNGTHQIDMLGLHTAGKGLSQPIIIENGVWIGANSTIIGGVSIGKKSIIAAGSVVVNNIPAEVLATGIPCKPIKRWNNAIGKMVRINKSIA